MHSPTVAFQHRPMGRSIVTSKLFFSGSDPSAVRASVDLDFADYCDDMLLPLNEKNYFNDAQGLGKAGSRGQLPPP